jgi:hypothetical protein
MSTDITLTSYILNPWDGTYSTGTKIALSYANLDFVPSAGDPYKSTSGDIFKVYVNGTRIYRSSDQNYASGNGFLEDGDVDDTTLNGTSASWTDTSSTVWEIDTTNQVIYIDTAAVIATTLYGPSGLNVTFAADTTIIELMRNVQDRSRPAIDYSNASILTEQDLDNSNKNVFHMAQQAILSTEGALLFDSGSDTYKATQPGTSNPKRISNVATPTSDSDAATKAYVDSGIGPAIQTVAGVSDEVVIVSAGDADVKTLGAGYDGKQSITSGYDSGTNTNISQINTVANNISNVNSVGSISADVTTVAGISADVTSVAADATDIGTVAGLSAEIGRLGTIDAVSDMSLLGTADVVADMNLLATSDVLADMNLLANADVIADMALLANADVISDMNALATTDVISDMNALEAELATITTKVNKSGDTMTGDLTLPNDPTNALHASTKQYVDSQATALAIALG